MSNKKTKLCLLMLVMLLGACSFSNDVAFAKNEAPITEVNQDDIKANKETLEKAEEAIVNKDFQSAIVYLTAYINSKPKKYEAYKLRGDAFYALHQFRLAEADYQKAIALKTEDDKFVTGTKVLSAVVLGADKQSQYQNSELGNLYGRLMYAQKALNNPTYEGTYAKAFEYNSHIYLPKPKKEEISRINCPQKYGKILNPQGVDEYIMGAISKIEEGDYHSAIFKAQYVTSNYPKYYLGHYLLGVAMAGMEQYDNAVQAFENSLKYNPYDFETFASLGQLFYRKAEKTFSPDEAKKSIEYFKNAIKYNSNCHIYHYYIGLNQMIIGNYDMAIASFDSAIKLKSNDYNSIYYKLVAQHIKGNYSSVVDGTTSLLYRHVSNYNSVLYLRALAYYKLGRSDSALADLDKIHNNMNDIYNEDVRPLSQKEQTLSNYLYYLKAQILQDLGSGVKADLQKAYQNPIIAELADGKVSPTFVLTQKQVDTEYDYIRTTFNDLNIGFEYLNPNYKIVVMTPVVNDVALSSNKGGLKLSTDPMDKLSTGQTSIAQMLAAQSFGVVQPQMNTVKYEDIVKEVEPEFVAQEPAPVAKVSEVKTPVVQESVVVVKEPEVKTLVIQEPVVEVIEEQVVQEPEIQVSVVEEPVQVVEELEEAVEEVVQKVMDDVKEVEEQAAEVVEDQVEEFVQDVKQVEEQLPELVEDQVDQVSEVVETVPEEEADLEPYWYVKASKDLENVEEVLEDKSEEVISQVEEVVEQVVEEPVEQVEEVVENINEVVEKVDKKVLKTSAVVEKHAKVDMKEFNTVSSKKVLEVKDDDEVIEFKPKNLFDKVEKSKPKVITSINSKEQNKIAEEIKKNQQLVVDSAQQEVAKVNEIVDEVKSNIVDVNITQSDDAPAVVVPSVEVKVPEVEKAVAEVKEVIEEVSEEVQKEVDISADKALNDILEAEKNAVDKVEEIVEKPKKSWFGWFKRNKKDNSIDVEEDGDDIVVQTTTVEDILSAPVEDVKEQLEEVKQDVVEEQKQVKEDVVQQPKKLAKKLTKKVEKVKPEIAEEKPEVAEVKQEIVEVKQEVAEVKQEVAKVKQEVAEVKQEVVEVKQEVVEEIKEEVKQVDDVLSESEIPLIRTTKAEIEELIPEIEVVEQKKKFTWWWNREKSTKVKTQCMPEEKVKNKKIDWKKFFTPNSKSEIKEVEVLESSEDLNDNLEK